MCQKIQRLIKKKKEAKQSFNKTKIQYYMIKLNELNGVMQEIANPSELKAAPSQ